MARPSEDKWGTFICPECGHESPLRRSVKKHMTDNGHTGEIIEKHPIPCEVCGDPAEKVNDEYEGCVPYPLCDFHYGQRNGIPNLEEDFFEYGEICEQCGEKPFKYDPVNGHPYCRKHYEERIDDNPAYYGQQTS
jgi:hypothetical protein